MEEALPGEPQSQGARCFPDVGLYLDVPFKEHRGR